MASSTQDFLEFEEIREGTIVLQNRSIRGLLLVSSANFALKSEEEQDAIIFQFQSFLNSLDFSLQVVIQSRKLNITGYIDRLKELEQGQTNELLKIQTAEYRKFVESLIEGGSILAKNFFVVVPFALLEALPGGELSPKLFKTKPKVIGKLTDEEFDRMKTQLWQRMEFVALGLRRMGLHVAPLSSEELVELLWTWYHPEEAEVGYYPEVPPELLKQTKKTAEL
ncbi:MAG: hypothetical protein HYT49_01155 [Candidatus Wildermuthbacteria bacterium]|nr:hypothetical protein [Candidatus Wildermuthbacteria bacterium]